MRLRPRTPDPIAWHIAALLAPVLVLCPCSTPAAQTAGSDSSPQAYRILVTGEADGVALEGMVRRLQLARAEGATTVILEIDTEAVSDPHAPIVSAGNAIFEARKAGMRVIAWVPRRAAGWGAILALACGDIYMGTSATIGNAAPAETSRIFTADDITRPGSVIASLTSAVENWSEQGQIYPVALAQAMIDQQLEVSRVLTDRGAEYWTAQDVVNPPRPVRGDPVQVVAKGTVLELTTALALRHGLCRRDFHSISDLYEELGVVEPVTLEPGSLDQVARIISSVWVTIALIAFGCIGVFIEAKTPGFGVGGAMAIIGFGALFLGHYIAGSAEGWEILTFVIGILLLMVELFLIPGFGAAGILGVCFIMASLFLITLPEAGTWSFGDSTFMRSLLTLLAGLVIPIVIASFLVKLLPQTPLFGRIVLKDSAPPAPAEADYSGRAYDSLVGQSGYAATMLRPAGRVVVAGDEYDATTSGELIESRAEIVVERVQGRELVVRLATAAPSVPPSNPPPAST